MSKPQVVSPLTTNIFSVSIIHFITKVVHKMVLQEIILVKASTIIIVHHLEEYLAALSMILFHIYAEAQHLTDWS